jgi:cell fate regulator YaaT (PSP1 superfamily)
MHNAQAQVEIKCTEVARHKVQEHRLPMSIVDSEYQFDRKKLTFYYDSNERIDFRDLVRELYKLYRARIWMSKLRQHDNHHDHISRHR